MTKIIHRIVGMSYLKKQKPIVYTFWLYISVLWSRRKTSFVLKSFLSMYDKGSHYFKILCEIKEYKLLQLLCEVCVCPQLLETSVKKHVFWLLLMNQTSSAPKKEPGFFRNRSRKHIAHSSRREIRTFACWRIFVWMP